MYSTPFYENVDANGPYTLEYPSTILACLAFLVTIPIYVFYYKGEWFRNKSRFAQTLGDERKGRKDKKIKRVEYNENVEEDKV